MLNTITHYLCIGCPLGCRLEVEEDDGKIVAIRGFSCKRGKEYAAQEHTNPRRIVTTTVGIVGGIWPRLPVKTAFAVPKDQVRVICEKLRNISVTTPITMGQVILSNVLESGIDVIACRDMLEV